MCQVGRLSVAHVELNFLTSSTNGPRVARERGDERGREREREKEREGEREEESDRKDFVDSE